MHDQPGEVGGRTGSVTTDRDTAAFPLGVGSFDPLSDRVLLWTYVVGRERCEWTVAADPAFEVVIASGEAVPAEGTGTVTVDVDGLDPATTYWYRFATSDGASSEVGRTRTLPADGAERVRMAAVCCARFGQSEFYVYRAVADADVDLVVHLGDYVYEDSKADLPGREPEPPHDCVTLDDYRARHAQARRDPDARALHAAHPMVVIWDDHDLADNAWRGGAKSHDPETQGPWSERLDAALRSHQEFLPKRLADPGDLSSAWRCLDGGDLFRIVCTEGRAHRDEQAGIEGATTAEDPARTMLGAGQARWLEEALIDGSARWAVVLSGTVMSELVLPAPEALDELLPEKYAVVDGCATNTDQWDGYLVERSRVASAMAERNGGTLVLSGDIHSSWAFEGPLGADGVPVAVELVCPPAATTPLGQLFPPGVGEELAPRFLDQLPGGRWVDVDHRGFLTLELTPDQAEATWWWVEPEGDTDGDDHDRGEGRGDGRQPRPTTTAGRRWVVPRAKPLGLVDPEPRAHPDGTPRDAPDRPVVSTPPRRRKRRALTFAASAAVVVAGARWSRARSRG